ncbi:TECT2 protein, partial [Amia calva]|nr:TECT2 protein [Amia calva]
VFQPAFILASGPSVTAYLLGNTTGITVSLSAVTQSNTTGTISSPSCTASNTSQWQLIQETVGKNALKVTLHLNRSLLLCGSTDQTDCCAAAVLLPCVVEALQVSACLDNNSQATLLVQAEIYAQIPSNGTVSEVKTVIPNQAYQPLGPCPCNLTAGACDIRCCCDQECTPELVRLFESQCFSGVFGGNVSPPFDQQCSVQAANNAPDWFPFLCVQSPAANSPFLGLFYQGATVNPKTSPSFETPSLSVPLPPNGYKQGDPIFIVGNRYFTIPQQSLVGQCIQKAPVAYLQDFQSSCAVPLTNCGSSPSLCISASDLSVNIHNGFDSSITISVREEISSDPSAFVSNPKEVQTLSSTQTSLICENVTLSLKYTFHWNGNNLTNVSVTQTIGRVVLKYVSLFFLAATLTQRFAAVFINGNGAALANSGNPGYQIGKPVIAGNGLMEINRTFINLWQPVGNGLCASAKTTPVLFGEDSSTGCFLRLNLQDLEMVHSGLAALVNATLVAKKGNSKVLNQTDWVHTKYVPPNITSTIESQPGTCADVPSHLNIRINTSVPRTSKSVSSEALHSLFPVCSFGVVTWQIQCGGGDPAACVNSTVVQSFPVSASVTFVAIPAQPLTPKTRFQINYTEYDCDRNDVCWPQLAFPLTRYYTGEPYSQSLAKGMILIFFFIVASVLGTPWNQIRQAWNN